jgi:hypothetical protein
MQYLPHDMGSSNSESEKSCYDHFAYDNNGDVTQKMVDGTITQHMFMMMQNPLTALSVGDPGKERSRFR